MYIGAISYIMKNHDTLSAMAALRAIGFESVEVWYDHPDAQCDYRKQDAQGAAETRRLIEGQGIVPRAYCVGQLTQKDVPNFRKIFEFARGFGVEVIVGYAQPAVVPELDRFCQEYRINYAIENVVPTLEYPLWSSRLVLQVVADCSEYMGANVDTGHFALMALTPAVEARALAGRIRHVHFKDVAKDYYVGNYGVDPGGHLKVPFGSGKADLAAVAEELKQQGYNRMVSVEHCIPYAGYYSPGADDPACPRCLSQALAYCRGLGIGS
jgi:sugar phosphate isomerase/epimerase